MSGTDGLSARRARLTPEQQRLLQARLTGKAATSSPHAEAATSAIARRTASTGVGVPLSHAQQRLWFLWQWDPASTAYHLSGALTLTGRLDGSALRACFDGWVQRHESLRTVFRVRADGRPEQLVQPAQPMAVAAIDLRHLPASERRARADEQVRHIADRPFDLTQGPLLRVTLLRLEDEVHLLAVVMHHIVSDAVSMKILIDELSTHYTARLQGLTPSLPTLPIQYADYAAWQRGTPDEAALARDLAYWTHQLGSEHPVLMLPADHPRPARPDHRAARHGVELPEQTVAGLRRRVQAQGGTLFMALLAGFQALLYRCTGQSDLRVGVPVANRHRPETQGVVGFFVNTQVMRVRIDPALTMDGLLAQTRDAALAAQAHQELPFEQLVEALKPERGTDQMPLFQVVFNHLREDHGALARLPGLTLDGHQLGQHAALCDLALDTTEHPDGRVTAVFGYAAALFDAPTIERMSGHYLRLLHALVDEPQVRVAAATWLSPAERAQLIDWGQPHQARTTITTAPDTALLHSRIERQARLRPEAVAVSFEGASLTYAELNQQANRLAHRLIADGVRPEMTVGLALDRSPEMVVAVLAVLKAGAAYVPLDPDYPAARLAHMASDSGLRVLITKTGLLCQLPPALVESPALRVLALDTLDLSALASSDPGVTAHPDNLAYIIYTSGSTGLAKGAQLTHRNVARLLDATQGWFGFDHRDVWTLFHSYAFDFSVWELFGALCHGGRLVVVPFLTSRSPDDVLALLRRERVTVLNQTPSAFRQLMQAQGLYELPADEGLALRAVVFGGEALEPASLRRWIDHFGDQSPRLINMYGITETTVHVTYRPILRADLEGQRSPIGVQIPDLALCVLDAELGLVPIGVPGELHVAGDGLARGYLHRAGLTAERFVASELFGPPGARLYRTGDLVKWRADGQIEYLGRIDQQVKIRGFRIELGEIEAQLLALVGVREALVMARPGSAGVRLVAYVSAQEGHDPQPTELREALGRLLPDYMVPAAWVLMPGLPINANGKVDRAALPEPAAPQAEAGQAPQGPLEQTVADIFSALLNLPGVGRDQSFFDLGGHSLLATQLVARLHQALGRRVSLRQVFEQPTPRGLALGLGLSVQADADDGHEADRIPQGDTLVPVPRQPDMLLSPIQQRLWLVDRMATAAERRAYNMVASLDLEGRFDLPAAQRALAHLIERHEVLRTAYVEDDEGDPVARIHAALPLPLPVTDLSALPDAERSAAVDGAVARAEAHAFDLSRPPLVHAAVLRLSAAQHVLILGVHHIVFDGWSHAVFVREFVALYAAFTQGRGPELPALPVQYADYAAWQRRKLASGGMAPELAFWRRTLEQAPLESTLPHDHVRNQHASGEGDVVRMALPASVAEGVAEMARQTRTTAFTVLVASFLRVLHEWSGQDDLVIGTDVAGRHHPAVEDLMGFFVNVVPLRSRGLPPATGTQWVSRVGHDTLAALDHQELPFDHVVDTLALPRRRGLPPLVQVLFVLQNMPQARFELPGLRLQARPQATIHAKFDLAVFVQEHEGGLAVEWVYATSLYERGTVAQAADAWQALLVRMLAAPDQALITSPLVRIKENAVKAETTIARARARAHATPAPASKAGKLDKLRRLSDKGMEQRPTAPRAAVRTSFLAPGRNFPLVVEPVDPDLDAVAWARSQRDDIESLLSRHGGLLLRNFGLRTPQAFEALAEAIEPELYGGYGDLPKKEGGRNTYRSTPYPEQQMILYHNESAHLGRWPRKQWFFCELPSPVGGATPIVDGREMLRLLPAELVARFERDELLYVRTFTDKLDVSWRDFFKTEHRHEVETRLNAAGIEYRWLAHDELQTRTRCPAVITHPVTGERVFFNQVQLHHPSCLEPDVRSDLLGLVGEDRLPRNVLYGDGSRIGDDTMALIGQAYEACAVRFPWRQGDVIMLDNMIAAHARDPYEGPRKIVVAMGAMFDRAELAPPPALAAGGAR